MFLFAWQIVHYVIADTPHRIVWHWKSCNKDDRRDSETDDVRAHPLKRRQENKIFNVRPRALPTIILNGHEEYLCVASVIRIIRARQFPARHTSSRKLGLEGSWVCLQAVQPDSRSQPLALILSADGLQRQTIVLSQSRPLSVLRDSCAPATGRVERERNEHISHINFDLCFSQERSWFVSVPNKNTW